MITTDGSHGSLEATKHAADIAARYEATLHAISVVGGNVSMDTGRLGDDVWKPLKEERRKQAMEHLDEVKRIGEDHGVPVITAIPEGPPAEQILDYADDHGIDLIVTGIHGRSGGQRFLIGSVTEKIVRNAAVPVVTVPLAERSTD